MFQLETCLNYPMPVIFYRLCDECRTLIKNHDQINLLSHARNNLNKTFTVCCANMVQIFARGECNAACYALKDVGIVR